MEPQNTPAFVVVDLPLTEAPDENKTSHEPSDTETKWEVWSFKDTEHRRSLE